MYSRYVPPLKGATKRPEPQPAAELPSAPPVKPQPTIYARYVPPPKTSNGPPNTVQSSQHVRFDEEPNASSEEPPPKKAKLARDDSPEKSKKKPKKSKKDAKLNPTIHNDLTRKDTVTEPIIENGTTHAQGNVEIDTPSQGLSIHSSGEEPPELVEKGDKAKQGKKEKKEKKKKKKSEAESQPNLEEDTPTRHKAVLEKKARSIRNASEPAVVTAEEDQDVPMEDATGVDGDGIHNDTELHGLEPLPQPEPVAPDTTKPTYETLPPWLAEPIRVSTHSTAIFSELGLSPELGISPQVSDRLSAKGYTQAFAIQTGVIPLLLPHHCKSMQGDVLVSAATGSGKTLAYMLPMIRDISQGNRHTTRLRGLIVLPTRELVRQVQQVCEQCAGVFAADGMKRRVRFAIAMGSQSLQQEQTTLIERGERHDPEAYRRHTKRLARWRESSPSHDTDEGYDTEDEEKATIRQVEDKIKTLPDHVLTYNSKTDVLICTPGRLVEHIKYTPGFTLDYVRWLVVDEADKLLGQNFQQWLDNVIPRLETNDLPGARNHKQSNLTGVRKVVLSATMTRDLDRLEGLKLRRPKLVVLEGSKTSDDADANATNAVHALPALLEEAALKASDPSLKPLFLLDLLSSSYILGPIPQNKTGQNTSDDETSSSGSDPESDSDDQAAHSTFKASSKTLKRPTVLIFTKSNETALRLSRLLSLLSPALSSLVGTLTSTSPFATRRDTMRSFLAGNLRVLVASDLVARGIDLPSLDHVINYDMPASIASYVHRVGRTARAGKPGKAWTLFTNPEARWFWNEVASEAAIQRSGKVERLRLTEEKEDSFAGKVAAYESALEKLGQEAGQTRSKDDRQ